MFCISMDLAVPCPWCGHGEILADKQADIRISCKCNICKKFYEIDFLELRSIRAKPKRRQVIKRL